ncbi:MAG: protein kinase domain-containing protein, partial [Planctomycetota bacterium]|jgi:WD40 repeat protein
LQQIGEGGMGLVYLAEQKEPVKRQVALKIIKPGMDSREVIGRFEAERQALALLDHPNIARVFDAGTTGTGRPYFVMEHVKGMSITRYCDDRKLNIEQRLNLFKQVCEALHHAHQKGIIHRDIKPSNILVSVHGDRAVPKIIDFGIAKATSRPLTDKTVFTYQGQLLGTPEYMSPEQVDLATQDIDTRSDIYSLGVVLYELLAGVLPFEKESFRSGGFAEIQRTIREEEPATPSMRLTNLGEKAKEIARSRKTQVVTLTRRLHRELEWIPMKAMRKERTRRYRSASELADDIQNYLNGSPLIAGPETAVYRAKKFVHKHAGSVVTVALVAVAIVLGLIVSTAMYFRAEQARKNELVARTKAEQAEEVAEERAEDYRRALYANTIQLAAAKYQDGNIQHVHELLNDCPKDLRGWEWNRLNYIMDQSLLTLRGHRDVVWSVAISPDGRYIVSGSWDETIKIWDAATGHELRTIKGHNGSVNSVAFSPDGRRIISGGGGDSQIKVWDAKTGSELLSVEDEHEEGITAVAFSPDGKQFISGGYGNKVKLWDSTTGSELATLATTFAGYERGIASLTYRPDGKQIIVGGWDTVRILDVAKRTEVMTIDAWGYASISPDGNRIVTANCSEKVIKVWDATSGKEILTLCGHGRRVRTVAFSGDGKRIVSSAQDNIIKVWDAETGAELLTLRGHLYPCGSVTFSPDGNRIISGGWDEVIKVWDARVNHEVMTLGPHGSGAYSVAFSPDAKQLASTSRDGTVKVWDVSSGAELRTLKGHNSNVNSVAFSPDGKQIVSGSWDTTLKVWDVNSGNELMKFSGHKSLVSDVSFSPDGKRIVSGSSDNTVKVWDAATGSEIWTLEGHNQKVKSVAYSPDGKRIFSGGRDKLIKVWDAKTGRELITFFGDEFRGVNSIAISPDGKLIACGGEQVKVFDAATGAELTTLTGHKHIVECTAFSPDGRRIASGSRAGTVTIWDIETSSELLTLDVGALVWSLAFSPDGKTIAIGSDNNTIGLWESEPPINGYEVRKPSITARKLVDKLHEEHGSYSKVIDELKAHKTLDEPVRKVALQIANARLWEDAEKTE